MIAQKIIRMQIFMPDVCASAGKIAFNWADCSSCYFNGKYHAHFMLCIDFATSDKHLTEFYEFVLQKVNELIQIIVIFMVSFSFDLSVFS